ncbi:hypothetical protein, partial [Bosea sp. (in: a-proteobacteria)]|uniref:hypothetical protein n=1 Tax=Bosea sp. (in: a-proteobacteria) TaxID=1871050 RepID=UPI004034ED3B
MAMQRVSILLIPRSHKWVQVVEHFWNGPGKSHECQAALEEYLKRMTAQEVVRVTLEPGQVLGMRGYTIHAGDEGRVGTGSVRVHFYASTGFVSDTTCYIAEFGHLFDSLCQPTTEPRDGSTPKVPAWQGEAAGGKHVPKVPYKPPAQKEADAMWDADWLKVPDLSEAGLKQLEQQWYEAAGVSWPPAKPQEQRKPKAARGGGRGGGSKRDRGD